MLIKKVPIIISGLGIACLGMWGIYEFSITVKQGLIREGVKIREDYSELKDIRGLDEFINVEKGKKTCDYVLSIRRGSPMYSEAFQKAKTFCAETPKIKK